MTKLDIQTRGARPADTSTMVALERESPAAAHWPVSFYLGLFADGAAARISLVAEEDGVLRGFLIARITGDECELENVIAAEASQRCGVASRLIRALIDAARDRNLACIFLEVRDSNAAARALYEKCGFAIHGRRKSYYTAPAEDAVLYNLVL